MLDNIVKTVAKKANIPELAAQVAVNTVVASLKEKLPSALKGALDSFLGTTGTTTKSTAAKKSTSTTKKSTTTAKKATSNANTLDIGTIAGALVGLLGKK